MYRKYAAMGYQASKSTVPMPNSTTPVEDIIRAKITAAFDPTVLEIENQSHLHAHHKAMAGNTSKETHFKLHITSEAFASKMAPARHRMVYALLGEEMAREGGIHALSLRTTTPEEETRRLEKAKQTSVEGENTTVATH
ncbi:hypothetical protein BROUX41_005017 [Berkeleyomyces rouxiae]|uniref:uncharacterized protein n=1 Tax=Berkeleyomyces rouxiae TaxID=2035830 RepID=UPI003B8298E4